MKEFFRTHKKAVLIGLSAMLLAVATIGGTLAWLTSNTNSIVNTFTPGKVDTFVDEKFPNRETKNEVRIQNGPNANVPAFIRVALVPIWRNANGDGLGIATEPVNPSEYSMDSDWFFKDGYYYYKLPVAALDYTDILLTGFNAPATPAGAPVGAYYELQILAQSIQADGTGAANKSPAEIVWGVNVQNGELVQTP